MDGEMSGADISRGHKLIQIGVASPVSSDGSKLDLPDVFCSLVGWDDQELVWDERAAQVHKIPRADVLSAPRPEVVDAELHDWLCARGASANDRGRTTICGFNVGAFDAPFIKQALPRTFGLLSRRYADLNPVCMLFGGVVRDVRGGKPNAQGWKRRLTAVGLDVVARMGRVEPEHNAGTDAVIALSAWNAAGDVLESLDGEAYRWRRSERERRIDAMLT